MDNKKTMISVMSLDNPRNPARTLTPGTHWMREQRVCVAEPLAFHFGAHVNRLEQPHSPRETRVSREAAASRHLEIRGLAYFLRVTRAVLSRNRQGTR